MSWHLLSLLMLFPLLHQPFLFLRMPFVYLAVALLFCLLIVHGKKEEVKMPRHENEVHRKANNVPFSVLNTILMMFLITWTFVVVVIISFFRCDYSETKSFAPANKCTWRAIRTIITRSLVFAHSLSTHRELFKLQFKFAFIL